MSAGSHAVFDCNVFLQAMISSRGPAHECWQRVVSGEVMLYVTKFIVDEIRGLPSHPNLRRLKNLTPERVERFIAGLLQLAVSADTPPSVFEYARDPDDAHYVNLALATDSQLIVSNDKDLLALMEDDDRDGQRLRADYPQFRVFTPAEFLKVLNAV
jgi:putative PIN family toxin of toxin-antitoxin system